MTADDQRYTKIGPGLFSWQPYLRVRRESSDAAHLWQALYMSAPAKLVGMPGLWVGSVGSMMDVGQFTYSETLAAISVLERAELIEFDPHAGGGLLRLTKLPDRGEAATSPNTLKGWWSRRKGITDCGIRDRHLELMAWLHLPFKPSKRSAKDEMQRTWDETFGSALNTVPAPLRLSTAPLHSLSPSSPAQLDLLSRPMVPDMSQDMSRYMSGEDLELGSEKERGEVQERGRFADGTLAPPVQPTSTPSNQDLWPQVCAELGDAIGPKTVEMWLTPLTAVWEGNTLRVTAPNEYHRAVVRDRYARELDERLRMLAGRDIRVAI